ncbi:MAG: transglutaminase family protein [Planctomycetales bacterium]|nr:transglutaminase family protein [Planctomycetales bacterium]
MKTNTMEISPEFLAASEIIDYNDPEVRVLAQEIRGAHADDSIIARRCFAWVRDQIQHSLDYHREELTCLASNVLAQRTGYCYAKSHLLAALLRANGIPTGFCYQRLIVSEDEPQYCLHGMNAVYLKEHGWYRIDARGNRSGINAQFSPPVEKLAFSTSNPGEVDFREVWAQPLPMIVEALQHHRNAQSLAEHLPDLSTSEMNVLQVESAIPFMILNCQSTTLRVF